MAYLWTDSLIDLLASQQVSFEHLNGISAKEFWAEVRDIATVELEDDGQEEEGKEAAD